MRIIIIKRSCDYMAYVDGNKSIWEYYMAYVDGNKSIWEPGFTQTEAVGKLLISLCGQLNITIAWLPPTEPE